jgi:N-acetylglucosamine kinase-like BadF-type ATPase
MTFVGVDVGGTSTTAVGYRPEGLVVVTGPGANLRSSTNRLGQVLADCFTQLARRGVRPDAGCVGVAGSDAAMAAVTATTVSAWQEIGWAGEPKVVTDLTIAFRAGTAQDGLLLLSGTGACAARFCGDACVRRADGMGWLLGDVGSAVWLGTRALQAVAADLDRRGPATALTRPILTRAVEDGAACGDPRRALVSAVYALHPAELGQFAPLVTATAAEGDAVAEAILAEAVDGLLRTARAAAAGPRPEAIVLAGAVLTAPTLLSERLRSRVLKEFAVTPTFVTRPVVGAVRIAAASLGLDVEPREVSRAVENGLAA